MNDQPHSVTPVTLDWDALLARALRDEAPTREEALAILNLPDHETLRLVDVAWRVRRHFFQERVKVNVLLNAKSGLCAEDCHYCSQAKGADTGINRYRVLDPSEMVENARRAADAGAQRFCIVLSGRGGTWPEVNTVAEATRRIKSETNLEVCACMGLMLGEDGAEKARTLKAAGVDAYNHNVNTTEERYGEICTTHTYEDRLETLRNVQAAGISSCSGVILGMGESVQERVELAFALRDVQARSIPVNFLIPIDGTPLGDGLTTQELTPWACLRALAMFRLVNPSAELRASAGREVHLRSLQPLALMIANSLFLGDYLTESGQAANDDWRMLRDLGLQAAPIPVPAD